jgi:enoyl-CoA hydratase/carnithine racemase
MQRTNLIVPGDASKPLVRVARHGAVQIIELDDPDSNNALSFPIIGQLRAALADSSGAAATVLGARGRNFCSGGDHNQFANLGPGGVSLFIADILELFADLAESEIPIVARAHGASVGGGLEMALLADFIVAADTAWFWLPQVSQGGRIGSYAYPFLLARTGLGFTRKATLLGDRIGAAEALRAGLIDEVVDAGMLNERAESLAGALAAQPAAALRRARRSLAAGMPSPNELRTEAVDRREQVQTQRREP